MRPRFHYAAEAEPHEKSSHFKCLRKAWQEPPQELEKREEREKSKEKTGS